MSNRDQAAHSQLPALAHNICRRPGRVGAQLYLFTLVFCGVWSSPALAAEAWYQIEMILFSYVTPTPVEEAWEPFAAEYPANLLHVGASDPAPHTYEQLLDVKHYAELVQGGDPGASQPRQQFLFESRSRYYNKRTGKLERDLPGPAEAGPTNSKAIPGAVDTGGEVSAGVTEDTAVLPDEAFVRDSPLPFRHLPKEAQNLATTASILRRSTGYRLLHHIAWVQPIPAVGSDDEATAVLIEAGIQHDNHHELSGTVSFARSRFIHIDTQLAFTDFIATGLTTPTPVPPQLDDTDLAAHPALLEWENSQKAYVPAQRYPLQTSTRARVGEVHYIDHPYFGVIVRIDEYVPDDEPNP